MKKMLALLLACMTLTCTFASCGDSDEDGGKDTKAKSSDNSGDEEDEDKDSDKDEDSDKEDDKDSDMDEDSDKDSDKDEDDDKDEDSDKDEDKDDDEDEEEETEKPTKKSSKSSDSDLTGEWLIGEISDGLDGGLVIKDDGNISIRVDASSVMYFDYPNMYLSGMELGDDYITYDGDVISVAESGTDILTLTRKSGTSGSSKNYDGEYDFTSGVMSDSMTTAFASQLGSSATATCSAIIDGKNMFIDFEDIIQYTDNGDDTITISGNTAFFGDGFSGTVNFELDGDELTLTNPDGDTYTLTRWN